MLGYPLLHKVFLNCTTRHQSCHGAKLLTNIWTVNWITVDGLVLKFCVGLLKQKRGYAAMLIFNIAAYPRRLRVYIYASLSFGIQSILGSAVYASQRLERKKYDTCWGYAMI